MKLISSALIVCGGCLLMGMGILSERPDAVGAVGVGFGIIAVGFLVFLPAAYGEGSLDDIRKMLLDAYRLIQPAPTSGIQAGATGESTYLGETSSPGGDESAQSAKSGDANSGDAKRGDAKRGDASSNDGEQEGV